MLVTHLPKPGIISIISLTSTILFFYFCANPPQPHENLPVERLGLQYISECLVRIKHIWPQNHAVHTNRKGIHRTREGGFVEQNLGSQCTRRKTRWK